MNKHTILISSALLFCSLRAMEQPYSNDFETSMISCCGGAIAGPLFSGVATVPLVALGITNIPALVVGATLIGVGGCCVGASLGLSLSAGHKYRFWPHMIGYGFGTIICGVGFVPLAIGTVGPLSLCMIGTLPVTTGGMICAVSALHAYKQCSEKSKMKIIL